MKVAQNFVAVPPSDKVDGVRVKFPKHERYGTPCLERSGGICFGWRPNDPPMAVQAARILCVWAKLMMLIQHCTTLMAHMGVWGFSMGEELSHVGQGAMEGECMEVV